MIDLTPLNEMPAGAMLSTKDLADLLGLEKSTPAQWRAKGFGPKFIRLGGKKVYYPVRELLSWLDARRGI